MPVGELREFLLVRQRCTLQKHSQNKVKQDNIQLGELSISKWQISKTKLCRGSDNAEISYCVHLTTFSISYSWWKFELLPPATHNHCSIYFVLEDSCYYTNGPSDAADAGIGQNAYRKRPCTSLNMRVRIHLVLHAGLIDLLTHLFRLPCYYPTT